jgi:hypothetical protein
MKELKERIELDEEEAFKESMQNAYLLITNKLTFNELFDYNGCMLPYHPKKNINNSIIDELIDYFCISEEYEKCQELKNIKETKEYKKNFINL